MCKTSISEANERLWEGVKLRMNGLNTHVGHEWGIRFSTSNEILPPWCIMCIVMSMLKLCILGNVHGVLMGSYLWQETGRALWWDLGTPQHSPALRQSCLPVLLVILQPAITSLSLSHFMNIPFHKHARVPKLKFLPPRSSSRSGASSWTFSVLLISAMSVPEAEGTSRLAVQEKSKVKTVLSVWSTTKE